MRANEIAAMLAQQVESVAEYLLPGGKRDGAEWVVGSLDGEQGKSLKVRLTGSKAGVWKDFAEGEGGDLIGLWCKSRGLNLREAMREAKEYLGIKVEPLMEDRPLPSLTLPEGVKSRPVWEWLKGRGISAETLQAYQITATETEACFPSYVDGKLAFAKYRNVHDKAKMRCLKDGVPVLFGWQAIPDCREVVICEGEIDALSWYQLGYPALSVPNGAQGLGWVEVEYNRLEQFDKIYIAFDADKQGREGARKLIERLGAERCLLVDTGIYKDGNEVLIQHPDAAEGFIKYAKPQDPEELKQAADFMAHGLKYLESGGVDSAPGFNTPWSKLDNLLRFRFHELTILNGVNGHGKSQMMGQIMLSILAQGGKGCIASMELRPELLTYKMTEQAAGSALTDAKLKAAYNWYRDKLWLFALTGTAKASRLLEVFTYAHKRYGIEVFVIDSLMKCGIAEDDYAGQKRFIEAICDFKNTYPVHVFLVTHSRKGEDERKPTGKMDVKGSGSITDLADTVLTIWRNKEKEEVIADAKLTLEPIPPGTREKADALLFVNKQRNGEWEQKAAFWWDNACKQFLPHQTAEPEAYTGLRVVR